MTQEELICKQQIALEELTLLLAVNKQTVKALKSKFYSIGQPLNDNILQFNKEQLKWVFSVEQLINTINLI